MLAGKLYEGLRCKKAAAGCIELMLHACGQAAEYKLNRALFDQKARQAMHRHALPTSSGAAGMPAASAPQAAISMPDQVPDEAPSQVRAITALPLHHLSSCMIFAYMQIKVTFSR